jgi:hypothetical protein
MPPVLDRNIKILISTRGQFAYVKDPGIYAAAPSGYVICGSVDTEDEARMLKKTPGYTPTGFSPPTIARLQEVAEGIEEAYQRIRGRARAAAEGQAR